MKWDIKGQMLAAVGRDGDNRIFPIAWAVVEVEDNPNWLWFVQLLKKDLGLEDGADITIISDKHMVRLNIIISMFVSYYSFLCCLFLCDRVC